LILRRRGDHDRDDNDDDDDDDDDMNMMMHLEWTAKDRGRRIAFNLWESGTTVGSKSCVSPRDDIPKSFKVTQRLTVVQALGVNQLIVMDQRRILQ
jgi:hypothetical protein